MLQVPVRLRRNAITALVATVLVLSLLPALRASATYPGTNGRIAYVRSQTLETIRPGGAGRKVILNKRVQDPSWSPNGRKIVYVVKTSSGGFIEMANPDGTGVRRVRKVAGNYSHPVFNKAGNRIYFTWHRSYSHISGIFARLFSVKLDGTGLIEIKPAVPGPRYAEVFSASFGPGGNRIVCQCHPDGRQNGEGAGGNSGIYIMNVDGSNFRQLTPHEYSENGEGYDSEPDWSPSGFTIAFARPQLDASLAPRGQNIWVVRPDGTGLRRLTDSPGFVFFRSPVWSPDGSRIAFSSAAAILTIKADGGGERVVTNMDGEELAPAWQPLQR